MLYNIIEVKNLNHLSDELKLLSPVQGGYVRLYRGQNSDYECMIPSFYRKGYPYNSEDYSWKLAAQRIIKEDVLKIGSKNVAEINQHNINFPMNGLIQHYGRRSGGLDVTSDIEVALWFSQFKRNERNEKQYLKTENNHIGLFEFTRVTYEPLDSDFSYLYVFDCPVWESKNNPKNGDCVNLDEWFGNHASRPIRQKAWYIYADDYAIPNGDLKSFITVIFKIPRSIRLEINLNKKISDFFPLPTEDKLFERLLNSYFIKNEHEVFVRVLQIPEYYNKLYPSENMLWEMDIYVQTIRLTSCNNYFDSFLKAIPREHQGPSIKHEGQEWFIKNASLINMEIPDWHIVLMEADKNGDFYIPKLEDIELPFEGIQYNYFIELAKQELVAPKCPTDRVLRGVWIVQNDNLIGISLYYWGKDKFSYTKVIWYLKSQNGGVFLISAQEEIGDVNYFNNCLINALRTLQTYLRIPYFKKYKPFKLTYGESSF